MLSHIYEFQYKKNTYNYIAKISNFNIFKNIVLLIVALLTLILSSFFIINKTTSNGIKAKIIVIITSVILYFIGIIYLGKHYNKNKSKILENYNFIGTKCSTFEEYRTYNLLNYLLKQYDYNLNNDSFKDIYFLCENQISTYNILVSISPKALLIFTSIITLFSSFLSTVFSEINSFEFRLSMVYIIMFLAFIPFVIKNFINTFYDDLPSKIYKYKSLQIYIKEAEILHKKLISKYGRYYFYKNI